MKRHGGWKKHASRKNTAQKLEELQRKLEEQARSGSRGRKRACHPRRENRDPCRAGQGRVEERAVRRRVETSRGDLHPRSRQHGSATAGNEDPERPEPCRTTSRPWLTNGQRSRRSRKREQARKEEEAAENRERASPGILQYLPGDAEAGVDERTADQGRTVDAGSRADVSRYHR